MNPDKLKHIEPNPRSNEEIDRYNAAALAVAEKHGVAISDLNAYMRSWGSECYSDACHLTPAAFTTLGEEVAKRLREYI